MKAFTHSLTLGALALVGTEAHSSPSLRHPTSLFALVSRLENGEWIKVDQHSPKTIEGRKLPSFVNFEQLIADSRALNSKTAAESHPLESLQIPFPNAKLRSLGIGLSYPDHRSEVKAHTTVVFAKNAAPTRLHDRVPFRENLDYETEVSLLLHRHEPKLFGYLIHNDLTDRRIQVDEYDAASPGPGFSKSKSFEKANAHGVLMAVGSADLWKELGVELSVNGELRQTLRTAENLLNPEEIHQSIFSDPSLSGSADWVIVGTGTPAGTVFVAPSLWERIKLFVGSGFSMERARAKWLAKFRFLQPGDLLEFRSTLLGTHGARVER